MTNHDKIERIINGNFCVGCGACNITDSSIPIVMDRCGRFQARLKTHSEQKLYRTLQVCPFSDDGLNEDAIAEKLFSGECEYDNRFGYYRDLFIGHVVEDSYREEGTSGGVITWMLTELLRRDRIDAVAHVRKVDCPKDSILFRYGISETESEIRAGAKSRYYPIEMSEVLAQIKAKPGRYALVGLPCFIKAVRRLAEQDSIIKERIVFFVGLVCGHLKSKAFGDYFGWQVGIPPGQLGEIDFRVKLEGRSAGNYGVYLRGGGKEIIKPTRELLGSNWGHNFFRYSACNFCDDVFSETADISIGDAWLPEFENDPNGTSVIVVRNKILSELLDSAQREGRLLLMSSVADKIAESQAGGLRDRREGLAYRLYLKNKQQQWAPAKRLPPDCAGVSRLRRRIYEHRFIMGENSHVLWAESVEKKDILLLNQAIKKMIFENDRLYANSSNVLKSKLKSCIRPLWNHSIARKIRIRFRN